MQTYMWYNFKNTSFITKIIRLLNKILKCMQFLKEENNLETSSSVYGVSLYIILTHFNQESFKMNHKNRSVK